MLLFTFTHVVREAEIRTRAERLEVQAGNLPWFDWTDFREDAEAELLRGLRETGVRLNLREHQLDKIEVADGNGTWIRCSFVSETEMVVQSCNQPDPTNVARASKRTALLRKVFMPHLLSRPSELRYEHPFLREAPPSCVNRA
jgi:hypothetical protein